MGTSKNRKCGNGGKVLVRCLRCDASQFEYPFQVNKGSRCGRCGGPTEVSVQGKQKTGIMAHWAGQKE